MSRDRDDSTRETDVTRRQALRGGGFALGGLIALMWPTGAWAHGRGRHRGHDDQRYRRRFRRGDRFGYRRHDGYGRVESALFYFCGPCRHRFNDRGAFHAHLHHRHHIPFWRIPELIVRAAFGWAFYG